MNKQYYRDMLDRGRGYICTNDRHVIAICTFFVGDDDEKYLTGHIPWAIIDDDPKGTTLYIDQLIVKDDKPVRVVHSEFTRFLKWAKTQFPNIQRAKWVRVNAEFRKHGIKEGVKSNVHVKSIK